MFDVSEGTSEMTSPYTPPRKSWTKCYSHFTNREVEIQRIMHLTRTSLKTEEIGFISLKKKKSIKIYPFTYVT